MLTKDFESTLFDFGLTARCKDNSKVSMSVTTATAVGAATAYYTIPCSTSCFLLTTQCFLLSWLLTMYLRLTSYYILRNTY